MVGCLGVGQKKLKSFQSFHQNASIVYGAFRSAGEAQYEGTNEENSYRMSLEECAPSFLSCYTQNWNGEELGRKQGYTVVLRSLGKLREIENGSEQKTCTGCEQWWRPGT